MFGKTPRSEQIRMEKGLFRLEFNDPAIEEEFQLHYAEKTKRAVRVGLLVGVVIYALFFLVDLQKVSEHAMVAFFIRFALIIPMAIGILGFSYQEKFRGFLAQALLSTLVLAAGASVLAIDYMSPQSPEVMYYTGMMLVVFCVPLCRLLFHFALGATLFLVAQLVVYLLIVLGAGMAESAEKIFLMISAASLSLVISYFSDRHTRKEFALAYELEDFRIEAVAATQLKDKLVSLVSHDLRDPLSSIKAVVDIMKNFGDDLTEARKNEMMDSLNHNVDRMREIIGLLMRLKGIQGGEMLKERQWTQLGAVAEKAFNALRPLAQKRKVTLQNDVPPHTEVFADEALLAHVIQNLVSNAVRYTDAGGSVRVYCPEEEGASLAVEDSGVGMNEAQTKKIMTAASADIREANADGSSGWGIGLSLINEIIAAHGGRMWVKSQPGSGAVFYVHLPNPEEES
ncbi:MAG: HAMP domain-containing histidine kinase [Nitrospinota bacterium]|nr:HAMP domain-containing histidine kinase [Nitrospinota bacterium]MDH5755186.1 HAMP domain-containing histidine kinase [Nitrospinota bacterium]